MHSDAAARLPRRSSRARVLLAAVAAAALAAASLATLPAVPASAAPSVASRLVSTDPVRLIDTRQPGGPTNGAKVAGDSTIGVPVAGRVPDNATAVVLNATVSDPDGFGYITAYSGGTRPNTSNANTDEVGETAANLVVVPLTTPGDVRIYASVSTHVMVDLLGWFVPAGGDTGGRYRPVAPATARILDTRAEGAPAPLGAGRTVPITGRAGVPVSGVRAVALNVTMTETTAPGWLQVIPTGGTTAAGASSSVNATSPGQTVANLVIVPVGADGSVTLVGNAIGHVLVDVAGWFTDSSAPDGTDGLFVAVDPTRLADTRSTGPVAPGATLTVDAAVPGVDSAQIGAAFANLTVTDAAAPGYVTGYAGVGTPPEVSSINADRTGATVANAGIVATNGTSFGLFTSAGTNLVVDLLGWFTRSGSVGGGVLLAHAQTAAGTLIRYRSIGARGDLTDEVAMVYLPAGNAPQGGWPVMAIAKGPLGLADKCGVTAMSTRESQAIPWVDAGYAVVYADLEGLGVDEQGNNVPGEHPYLHGPSAARSILDAVRAARSVPALNLSDRVGVWGWSGGGNGALWVAEMAPTYAPELDVRGALAMDPVSMVSWTFAGLWTNGGFTPWMAQGISVGYGLPLEEIMKPDAIALVRSTLLTECEQTAFPIFDRFEGTPNGTMLVPSIPANWLAAAQASDPGQHGTPVPVLLAGGNVYDSQAPAVPHEGHLEYQNRACAKGTVVVFRIFAGDHMVMISPGVYDNVIAWMNDRMAGTPVTGACRTEGPINAG